jgi:hypothetical protein
MSPREEPKDDNSKKTEGIAPQKRGKQPESRVIDSKSGQEPCLPPGSGLKKAGE